MRAATLVVLAATLCVLLCLVSEADAHKKHLNKKARGLIVPMRKHRAQHHRVGIRATRDNMDKFAQMLVNDLDTYSVEVNIGTPPQKFLLNLDTGSNDLLVYAPTCPKENCPGAAYDQRASRSFTDVTCTASGAQGNGMRCNCSSSHCNYHAAYGDASFADGSVSRDRIIVGDLNQYSVETFFGQIVAAGGSTLESAAFYTNATLSGILGLAPTGAGSAYNLRSPILELADQHDLPVGFTLCLRPHVGGALVIGEDYSDTTVASYAWAKQTKNEMWTVKVNDISLGHSADQGSLGISGEHVLLDSGTTNIIFPENTEAKVKAAFKSFCPGLKGICDGTGASIWNNWIQLTEDELIAFPDLYVKVDGVYKTLRLTPAMYMTEYNGYYILNLDFLGNDIILGNGFMKNFRLGFDVDGKRIGFADLASCPGDNDLDEIRADPASFKVGAVAKPIGLQFEKPSAYQYAWLCGWNATSDIACNPATDATCKTSLATKPAYMPECPEDWNYAIGKDVEYQARWGRPLSAVSGQAGIGFDVSLVSAVPPFTIPFVFGQVKYYNSPIDSETYVTRIIVNSHTKFMRNVSEASTFADFEYDFHLKVTNFDVCEGLGCPWNDPKVDTNWPEKFINDECVETERGYRLINKDGPLCCPYYTSRNDFNQCSDLVELLDDGIADNDYVTLQGEKYKIMLTGFHAAVGGHRGRGLVRGFAADFNQLTRVNIHAQLIDLCPDCPPNTRQVRNEDGSCQCECAQTCKLPLSSEPDCSCVARISHSHCSADCGPEDAAALGCDTQRGEVFTKIFSVGDFTDTAHEVCGCRCVQGCPAGYKQSATCQCVCDCDPNAAPPAGANPQHNQCNKWICNENGVGCKYVADHAAQCDKYNWPIGQPKDPQCWAPKCVDVGQTAECQGVPQNVNPGACPVPAGVSPHCYVHKCDGAGHCSTEFISSTGGQAPGSPHLGNCPVPAGMDARCYWPYCDSTGNCAGDVFSGQPYTAAGDWKDGTMGTRPGQPACTVEELTDAGNAKYGKFNPECFVARCDGGKCGGDAVNFGQPCNPIDGRGTGGYNEVFVGDAWPGITADCVHYECGSAPGERGHCIQRALPGARQTPCHNSDNDLCTLDFCDGLGMCKDHEWIQGHHPEGVCVTSTCNPRTGEWTFERNGEACCENGVLNFGEECEAGVNGADKLCCVDCYLQNKCDDGNVCTSDTCVDGHCVSTVDLSFSNKCPPLDASVADNRCKLVACSAETGNCETMADPTKEGVECDADTDQCNHHVCRAGRCVLEADNVGQTCSLPTAADLTCKSLQCVARDGKGACEVVNDNSKPCNDNNACTSEACVDGACVPTPSVQCPAAADSCHAPGVCNPTTGACESAVLPDGTACPKPADANTADKDACVDYVCEAGQCVRSETGACICGNGKLDDGEECDWSIAAQKDCCSSDCTGCICGNGKLDEGEECDFNIPSQLECCNKECQGCKCGNGILDDGEACDPVLAEKNGECCNPDCTPCPVLARSSSIGVAVGAATAGLVVAFALAALIAVRASSSAAGAVGGAGPGAGSVTNAVNNPAFVPSNTDITSPIYQPMAN